MGDTKEALPEIRNTQVLRDCLATYSQESRILLLMEECSELIQACSKYTRFCTQAAVEHVAEEIADVLITATQVMLLFDLHDEIDRQLALKLSRLKSQLEELR